MYDGENTSSRLLGNYTRADMLGQVINSTSNRLWLEFNSNASGTNQGFRLTYTSELFGRLQSVVQEAAPLIPSLFTPLFKAFFPKCCQKITLLSPTLILLNSDVIPES